MTTSIFRWAEERAWLSGCTVWWV